MKLLRRINPFAALSLALHILLLSFISFSDLPADISHKPLTIIFAEPSSPAAKPPPEPVERPKALAAPLRQISPMPAFARKVPARTFASPLRHQAGPAASQLKPVAPAVDIPAVREMAAGNRLSPPSPAILNLNLSAGARTPGPVNPGLAAGTSVRRPSGDYIRERPAPEYRVAAPAQATAPERSAEAAAPGLSRASATQRPDPIYPDAARQQGLEGSVRVRFAVSSEGTCQPEIISSSGSSLLDAAAMQAARRWRFNPARRGEARVADTLTVTFRFNLQKG